MIKIIIGILVGAGGVYALANGTDDIAQKAKSSVHSVASEVADATEPSTQDQLGNMINSLLGGN